MEHIATAEVNGRRYGVRLFSPPECYEFYQRYAAAPKFPDGFKNIALEALKRCVSPDGSHIRSADDINAVFSRFPGDMFPLKNAAVRSLLSEFSEELRRYQKDRLALFRRFSGKQSRVAIPEGWGTAAFFDRIHRAGMCTYDKLCDGTIGIQNVFEMLRMCDWREYCGLVAAERMKKNKTCR